MSQKKFRLFLALLVIFAGIASAPPTRLVRLTVINKSGFPIQLSLTGQKWDYFYYLDVTKGSRAIPATQEFTIIPDRYASTLYFVELWDPVYGYQCNSRNQVLDIEHNSRLVVVECDRTPANRGEPNAFMKYGASAGGRRAGQPR